MANDRAHAWSVWRHQQGVAQEHIKLYIHIASFCCHMVNNAYAHMFANESVIWHTNVNWITTLHDFFSLTVSSLAIMFRYRNLADKKGSSHFEANYSYIYGLHFYHPYVMTHPLSNKCTISSFSSLRLHAQCRTVSPVLSITWGSEVLKIKFLSSHLVSLKVVSITATVTAS